MSLRPAPVPRPGLEEPLERPEPERLSADDQATQHEREFLDAALAHQRQRAAASAPTHVPGRCSNCGERVKKLLIYCDSDCRDDHARRLRALARR